jgi:dTDP-4-dehydrorhamnose reductase
MRVLVLGAARQLGPELCRMQGDPDLIPTERDEVDKTQLVQVVKFVEHLRPEVKLKEDPRRVRTTHHAQQRSP